MRRYNTHFLVGLYLIGLIAVGIDAQGLRSSSTGSDKSPATREKAIEVDATGTTTEYYVGEERRDKAGDESVKTGRPEPDEVHAINGTLTNWGGSYSFHPAVVVEPTTYEEIVNVVRDTSKYPSPVRAYGESTSTILLNPSVLSTRLIPDIPVLSIRAPLHRHGYCCQQRWHCCHDAESQSHLWSRTGLQEPNRHCSGWSHRP